MFGSINELPSDVGGGVVWSGLVRWTLFILALVCKMKKKGVGRGWIRMDECLTGKFQLKRG